MSREKITSFTRAAPTDPGENETRIALEKIKASKEKVSTIVGGSVKCLVTLVIASLFYLSIKALSGKVTQADIQLIASTGDGLNSYLIGATILSLIVGIFGVYYGERQRRFRKEQSAEFFEKKKKVRKQSEPDRTHRIYSDNAHESEANDE